MDKDVATTTSTNLPLLDLDYVNGRLAGNPDHQVNLDPNTHASEQQSAPVGRGAATNSAGSHSQETSTPESNTILKPANNNNNHGRLTSTDLYNGVQREPHVHNAASNGGETGSLSFLSSKFPQIRLRRRTEIILIAIFGIMVALATFCAATYATGASVANSTGNTINLSYGQFQGRSLGSGVTEFLGVRYAAPVQRFSAPQAPLKFEGVHIADEYGAGCKGSGTWKGTDSEDCLFADIYAPTGANSTSNLPVYVFIQGGGLTNAAAHFNGTKLVNAADKQLVTVSLTYRTGPFGFMASKEIQKGGALNLGYLDQHQLLQWVQKEIAQFGGNPNHVTLGGQSAGGGSVVNQLTAYGGVNKGLFHAALVESASMPPIRNVSEQQFQYDNTVKNIGCSGQADTLACLRSKSAQEILDAAKSAPYPDGAGGNPFYQWAPVTDGDFVKDIPVSAIQKGAFIKVPTIFGDVTDEGTIFTSKSIKTAQQVRNFIKNNWPTVTSAQLDKYVSMYDLDKNTGSPDYWKKAAQAYGETRYICPGIHLSNLVANTTGQQKSVWNWRYNVASTSQEDSGEGVSHGTELPAIWGGGNTNIKQLLATSQAQDNVVDNIQSYWISYIQTYDPNSKKKASAPTWTNFKGDNRVLFNLNGTTIETIDKGQMDRCGYLAQITLALKQ